MSQNSATIDRFGLNTTLRSQSKMRRIQTIVLYVVLGLLGVMFAFPFFWTLMSSLKQVWELYNFPPTFFPETLQFANYPRVLEKVQFALWMRNSMMVVLLSTTGAIISSSLVAYSFARFTFRGRDLIFMITLGTMMLPAQVTLIPQFVLFHKLGWINTLKPLWVPAWFGGGAFNIFLIRQFMMSLPLDLDEAAIIDGASDLRVFTTILIPLCKPALATVAVISFIGGWNDFVGPVIYLNAPDQFTVAVGLNFLKSVPESSGMPLEHLLMAASVMSISPILLLFFLAQRYFVQGIVLSGIKG